MQADRLLRAKASHIQRPVAGGGAGGGEVVVQALPFIPRMNTCWHRL